MQLDFFEAPKTVVLEPITLLEHRDSGYAARTGENARGADVTVAFASDFTTAGERLTKRMAGRKYVGIAYPGDSAAAAQTLAAFMASQQGTSLNVAGNGIYTLAKSSISQADVNQWVYDVLKQVHARIRLTHVRSGGQTGVDTAGLVAGIALGVPVTGLYPNGFRQRMANQKDVSRDHASLIAELTAAAEGLVR